MSRIESVENQKCIIVRWKTTAAVLVLDKKGDEFNRLSLLLHWQMVSMTLKIMTIERTKMLIKPERKSCISTSIPYNKELAQRRRLVMKLFTIAARRRDEHELPYSDYESINLNNFLSESEDEEQSTIDCNSADQSCGFKEKLASWVVDHLVKRNAVDSLLSDVLPVLPEYDSLKMPKTCRTLVQTPKKTPLKKVEPGSYFHFGLAVELNT